MTKHLLKIRVLHKCASSLQNRIYNYIDDLCGDNVIDFNRMPASINSNLVQATKNCDIIVLRNPVNRMISKYYSAGWTHSTVEYDDERWKEREEIKQLTLSEFVISYRLSWQRQSYERMLGAKNACIVRYEDIMNNPKGYIRLVLLKINRLDLFDTVYENFKHEFIFDGKDLSDDIVNKGLIEHRRNLDHKEYLNKFNDKCEMFFIDRMMGKVLKIYDNLDDQTIN